MLWELEDFDTEAPLATFEFQGNIHFLEFDGCVDDLIWSNLKNKSCSAVDISELYEAVPMLEDRTRDLSAGRPVTITLSSGCEWEARQRTSSHGVSVMLRAQAGQTATLFKNNDNSIRSLVLRTEARGITHEITARPDGDGSLAASSEAVTVYHPASR